MQWLSIFMYTSMCHSQQSCKGWFSFFSPAAAAAACQCVRCGVPQRLARFAEAATWWLGEPAPEESDGAGGRKESAVQRDDGPPPAHREHPELPAGEDHRAGEKYAMLASLLTDRTEGLDKAHRPKHQPTPVWASLDNLEGYPGPIRVPVLVFLKNNH